MALGFGAGRSSSSGFPGSISFGFVTTIGSSRLICGCACAPAGVTAIFGSGCGAFADAAGGSGGLGGDCFGISGRLGDGRIVFLFMVRFIEPSLGTGGTGVLISL